MDNMTLGNQEEDMMGHGHKAPEPSAGALEAVERIKSHVWTVDAGFGGWFLRFDEPEIATVLDAFAAAALTDEQRDVLTVWEWCKERQQGSLWLEDSEGHPRPFSRFLHGETWMQQAATWVREQGTKGER